MARLWSEHFAAAENTRAARTEKGYLCPSCNSAICRRLISNSPANPGVEYYKCPNVGILGDHNFFKWVREVKPDELIDVPHCGGCGAGLCRVRKEMDGPNAGRILFMCRVKEGEGSCGYRVWKDEFELLAMGTATGQQDESITSSQPSVTNCKTISTAKTALVEESHLIDEGADNESPVVVTSRHLQDLEAKSWKMERPKCKEQKHGESSRRPLKRSRYGDLKGSLVSSAQSLALRLAMNSTAISQECWMEVAISQNLSPQLKGWWGRLAFHTPLPCLSTPPLKHFTCYVSPPLDSNFTVEDEVLVESGASTTLTRRLLGVANCRRSLFNEFYNADLPVTKSSRAARDVPSCSDPPCETVYSNTITNSITKAFNQAAEHLQNELLIYLEKVDLKDPQCIRQATEATFSALDRLSFNYRHLKERAQELIHCATSLAEIEQSMPRNDSYQELVNKCSSERMRLDKINSAHAKAVDAVTSSKKRLKGLNNEIASAKEWLFQVESELSCCEVEMNSMEHELKIISKDKEVLEGKYLIASKELEELQTLREVKEAKCNAAKAAFDRARLMLRQ